VPPSVESLTGALADAARIALDDPLRIGNMRRAHIERDWSHTLTPVVEQIVAWGNDHEQTDD